MGFWMKNNNLVYNNISLGTDKVKSFKLIIQEACYPEEPIHFSAGSMACAMRTFEALKKNEGTQQELVDLMLFYVECGTQFTRFCEPNFI